MGLQWDFDGFGSPVETVINKKTSPLILICCGISSTYADANTTRRGVERNLRAGPVALNGQKTDIEAPRIPKTYA